MASNSASIIQPLVKSIKEKCRMCYTCVRECPAKAIRISQGQAKVIPERCIGCGNCLRVCSQGAKEVLSSVDIAQGYLASGTPTVAILAPSFPAEFEDTPYPKLVGALRTIGFAGVYEVGFGADLVAARYNELLTENPDKRYIATTCPGVVSYVEYYHPELVEFLAPIVSPMMATARALQRMRGPDLRIVFFGPCIAKKGEASRRGSEEEVHAVCTFVELRRLLGDGLIRPDVPESEFDRPHARLGGLFAMARGFLAAAGLPQDIIHSEVAAAEGKHHFVEAIREFETGNMDARLLEVLCCEGCIMGAGCSGDTLRFYRRSLVRNYVRERLKTVDEETWHRDRDAFRDLDLSRTFAAQDHRLQAPSQETIARILLRMGKKTPEDELNCGACGYETCREHAIAIHEGLAETEMCLPYSIDQLRKAVIELEASNQELASTQNALMQSEKLASMGQLAAGIAHEVNNPLGVVLMYAHLMLERAEDDAMMREDLSMIANQADRCKRIVSGLLNFARQNKVVREMADLGELIDHTLAAMHLAPEIRAEVSHEAEDLQAEIDKDQIGQVLVNLFSNAQGAMPNGGILTVRTRWTPSRVEIQVSDTGCGIPQDNIGRIFDPFFTTKQMGIGTGLGLAVSYGIVKMHCGEIRVSSNADPSKGPTNTQFTVILPRHESDIQKG